MVVGRPSIYSLVVDICDLVRVLLSIHVFPMLVLERCWGEKCNDIEILKFDILSWQVFDIHYVFEMHVLVECLTVLD